LTVVPNLPEELDQEPTAVSPGYQQKTGSVVQGLLARLAAKKPEIQTTANPAPAVTTAPAKPVHATEKESREARTKHRKIRGKLNEDDLEALKDAGNVVQIEGETDYISRKEADQLVEESNLKQVNGKYYRRQETELFFWSINTNGEVADMLQDFLEVRERDRDPEELQDLLKLLSDVIAEFR
jgi:hypothetical protein